MALQEPYRPSGDDPVYIVRLHSDRAAVLLRTVRSMEYEAHELTEPFSELIERLHRDGNRGGALAGAREEHRARLELEDRAARLERERDEARTAYTNAQQTIDELQAEVNRYRHGSG